MLKNYTPILLTAFFMLTGCGIYEFNDTQRQYVTARDSCRELAELRATTDMGRAFPTAGERQTRNIKKELLEVFADCMKRQGWSVSGPTDGGGGGGEPPIDISVAPPRQAAYIPPEVINEQLVIERERKRAAECAYARQAADNSSRARAIAKACEIECKNRLEAAPDGPRPGACAP